MASVRQGTIARAREWWQHLRPFGKRRFWKEERRAQAKAIDAEMEPDSEPAGDSAFARWASRYEDRSL